MRSAVRAASGRRWLAVALLASIGAGCASGATAADPRLTSGWLRPAAAGADARAYVDIDSDVPLTLVGATSPLARSVEIRVVTRLDGVDPGRPVQRLRVVPGTPTRLAYKGNHLLLRRLAQDVNNGTPVPVMLMFRDAAGHRIAAQADLLVRGLYAPRAAGG